MRATLDKIVGIGFLLSGILIILGATKILERIFKINKDSSWYKIWYNYFRKRGLFGEYLEERLSKKANRIIEIFLGMTVGIAAIILGLNVLLKGIIAPYEPGFWVLF